MKLKYNFVIRNVGTQTVAVAVGRDNALFNGMIKLNQTAEVVFGMLNKGDVSQEELVCALTEKYDIDKAHAEESVDRLIAQLRANELLEE